MDTVTFERIKSKIATNINGCWIWTGAKNKAGYGNMFVHGKYINSHRAMWAAIHGDIGAGQCICHCCDEPSCVNPDHLFSGTHSDNMQDKKAKGRALPGPTSDPEWWTAERRKERSLLQSRNESEKRASKADLAGVPRNWKYCPSCKAWFPREQFYRNKARDDGLKPYCKPCSVQKDVVRKKSR